MFWAKICPKRATNSRVFRCDFRVFGYSDGTLALMGHLLLPTASEAKREGGPTINP
jgi:hypothetical protein